MSDSERITVTATVAPFAAVVSGVDLARPLGPGECDAIRDAWVRHPVLVFPGQHCTPADLPRFAAAFGRVGRDPFILPLADCADVIEVRREANETTPIFGSTWHSDWSFLPEPPSATLIYGAEIPPRGGDTVFADGYRAFAALSAPLQTFLLTLEAQHSAAPAYGPRGLFARDDASRSMQIVVSPEAESVQVHPLVRRHPLSGRYALFINHVYTVGIVGMHPEESRALLEFLFRHMVKDDFVYRHRWQAGTVLMWDNRCVVHHAAGGYEGYRRVMYRTTMAGERPAA